jgi:hypothetical protein
LKTQTFVLGLVVVALAALCAPSTVLAKMLRGYQGIELGMDYASVLRALEAGNADFIEIRGKKGCSTMIRNDKLFRHADFIFDESGVLREIVLMMREVIKDSRILGKINSQYNMNLAPDNAVVREGVAISVKGNAVLIKDAGKMVVSVPDKAKESSNKH